MVWGPAQSIALVQDMRSLEWQVADMLSLPFQRGIFDAVIEKGTMDVLFVDNESPWDPTPEVRSRVLTMLDETHRYAPGAGHVPDDALPIGCKKRPGR